MRDKAQIYLGEKQDKKWCYHQWTTISRRNEENCITKSHAEKFNSSKVDTMQNKLHSLANKVEPQNKDLKQLNKSKTLKNSQNKKMLILKDKNCLN